MDTTPIRSAAIRLAATAVTTLVLAACSVASGAEPTPTPSATPGATVSPDILVDLEVVGHAEVMLAIEDPGDLLTAAASGLAGSGMSVIWNEVRVVNEDADTLRVTFVGVPADAVVRLVVTREGTGLRPAFRQPEPAPGRVWVAYDRVVLLDLAQPIDAASVVATMTTVAGS
jgi:hypothetical protein